MWDRDKETRQSGSNTAYDGVQNRGKGVTMGLVALLTFDDCRRRPTLTLTQPEQTCFAFDIHDLVGLNSGVLCSR